MKETHDVKGQYVNTTLSVFVRYENGVKVERDLVQDCGGINTLTSNGEANNDLRRKS